MKTLGAHTVMNYPDTQSSVTFTSMRTADWSKAAIKKANSLELAQQTIYDNMLEVVKQTSPELTLALFHRLFIEYTEHSAADLSAAMYKIVIANNKTEFLYTLKRVCYILVNNWAIQRRYSAISQLIAQFNEKSIQREGISPLIRRLRTWLREFVISQDFRDLQLFVARYEQPKHWSERYITYLLAPQYLDDNNPAEQREAAQILAQQLKSQFRFELAMYTSRTQFNQIKTEQLQNPTALGDSVLPLIKRILLRRGYFSYENLANVFIQQCENVSYRKFKQGLAQYLTFAMFPSDVNECFKAELKARLKTLYSKHDNKRLTDALILRTCNRIIEMLITEDQRMPSPMLNSFVTYGNPLALSILLLKLALLCPHSQAHMEWRLADLIRYYKDYQEEDCQWTIQFFEIFRITFAIYSGHVNYSLIDLKDTAKAGESGKVSINLDAYRIFSQLKQPPSHSKQLIKL